MNEEPEYGSIVEYIADALKNVSRGTLVPPPNLGTQSDYVLAGDKDAPEGTPYPITPGVMK